MDEQFQQNEHTPSRYQCFLCNAMRTTNQPPQNRIEHTPALNSDLVLCPLVLFLTLLFPEFDKCFQGSILHKETDVLNFRQQSDKSDLPIKGRFYQRRAEQRRGKFRCEV